MTSERTSTGLSEAERLSLLAHDLRAALSDVLGGVQLVDASPLDPQSRAHFDRAVTAGQSLARLIDEVLTGQSSGPRDNAQMADNVVLSTFLDEVRQRWTDAAAAMGCTFRLESGSDVPAVVTLNQLSLERILANLIGNACKFSEHGLVVLTVDTNAAKDLVFQLRDHGPGLSDEAEARLFQFEGRPSDSDKPGSGLGLFIAKSLSEKLGGTLSLANHRDGGVVARLALPAAVWKDRTMRRGMAEPEPAQRVDLSGLRILVAEDNLTNQLVATRMLAAMGATYEVAADGREALEIFDGGAFDLLLLDIEMPRMTGIEVIRTVRAMPDGRREIPIIALTAYVMAEHRDTIRRAGADDILAKPVLRIEDLGRPIKRAIAAARSGRTPEPDDAVDRSVFDALLGAIGPEFAAEFLTKMLADIDRSAEGISLGLKTLDMARLRSETHILSSLAGAVGAEALVASAKALNTAAHQKDPAEIERLCVIVHAGLAAMQSFVLGEQARLT